MHWENRGWQGKKRGCYFCFDPNKDAISWLKVAEIWCCVDLLLPLRVHTIVEFILLIFLVFFLYCNFKQFIREDKFIFSNIGKFSLQLQSHCVFWSRPNSKLYVGKMKKRTFLLKLRFCEKYTKLLQDHHLRFFLCIVTVKAIFQKIFKLYNSEIYRNEVWNQKLVSQ